MPSRGQSCVIAYRAWNATVGAFQSGDGSNHNLKLLKDATEASPANATVEVDGTVAPGLYYVALTSAEATFNTVTIAGKSSTAGVSLFGQTLAFEQLPVPAVATAGGLLTLGSSAGQISSNLGGIVDGNVAQWLGTPVQLQAQLPVVLTVNSGGTSSIFNANVVQVSGQPVQTGPTGLLSVSIAQISGVPISTHFSGVMDANVLFWNQKTAQSDAQGLPSVNVQDINGSPISAALATSIVTTIAIASGAAQPSSVNLSTYLTDLQNILGVGATSLGIYTQAQLVNYINKARKQVAQEGQCIRVLTPPFGPISSIAVTSGGLNYTNPPTVQITPPDSPPGIAGIPSGVQASAIAAVSGGSVVSVTVQSGGNGYFQPIVTLVSGGGFGATAIATTSGVAQTITNQEVYAYSNFNNMVAVPGNGISDIHAVRSVSVIWGTFRYTLIHKSFSQYQAYVRNYTAGYTYIPSVWTQYGQGENGSIYLYPIPNTNYPLELDCQCTPLPLNQTSDPEAIPSPWTDAVPLLAAYWAYTGSQRNADADRMWKEYEKFMVRARQQTQPSGIVNPYGRA